MNFAGAYDWFSTRSAMMMETGRQMTPVDPPANAMGANTDLSTI
ncbi:hypothetical protein [Salipiger aestuarii]|nr:hypothetical protein [Salipiger aestuarii]